MTAPLDGMIAALRAEADAARTRGGRRLSLQGGERVGPGAPFLYRFALRQASGLRDDAPLRIVVGEREVPGAVAQVADGSVVVALEEDLGPSVPAATLASDAAGLLDALRERLEAVAAGRAPAFDVTAADHVLGRNIAPGSAPSPIPLDGLDDHQRQAVERALGSNATFIWGPPGTGKTRTLARLIAAERARGRSVLVVANTNAAVDELGARLTGELSFSDGEILRVGAAGDPGLRERIGLTAVADRRTRALAARRAELDRSRGRLAAEAGELEEALSHHASLEQLRRQLRDVLGRRADAGRRVAERAAAAAARTADGLRARLHEADGAGLIWRWVSGPARAGPAQSVAQAERRTEAAEADLARARRTAAELQSGADRLAADAERLERRAQGLPTAESCRRGLEAGRRLREKVDAQWRDVAEALRRVSRSLTDEARVVLTTAARLCLPGQIAPRCFDVVVMDEASSLTLPAAWFAAGWGRASVVVAGDFRQLPAVVLADGPAVRAWLRPCPFEASGVAASLEANSDDPRVAVLRTQYRMAPAIASLVSDAFYGGRLRCAPEVHGRRPPEALWSGLAEGLRYVDTGPLRPWASYSPEGTSRVNVLHSLVVRALLADGRLPAEGSLVGVGTPYAAQARLLQAAVSEVAPGVTVATAHRFQGSERAAIVVELTESHGVRPGAFLSAATAAEEGARLLNVAMSRAQHVLVVVAHFAFLRAALRGSLTGGVLDRVLEEGGRVEPGIPWAAGPGSEAASPDDPMVCNANTFLGSFARDLASAQRRVAIFAPFLTRPGVERLAAHLRGCVERGVEVRVVTRPARAEGAGRGPDLAPPPALHRRLRDLGAAVEERPGMHEKVALIDAEVTWCGSLNILSYGVRTTEIMIRHRGAPFQRMVASALSGPTRMPAPSTPAAVAARA